MAEQTYIDVDTATGEFKRKQAPNTSAGSADAYKIFATGADGKFSPSVIPDGSAVVENIIASEAISARAFINIYNVAGARRIRLASATDNTKPAHGFVEVGVNSTESAVVELSGVVETSATGFVAGDLGKTVFLSTTSGAVTKTPPSTTGNVIFILGEIVEVATNLRVRFTPRQLCVL